MKSYFELRSVSPDFYSSYRVPAWLRQQLQAAGTDSRILDFGCGFGQVIDGIKISGYPYVEGVDVEPAAIAHCRARGHLVHDLRTNEEFYEENRGQFSLIVALHVLEHIAKSEVVNVVARLRGLLKAGGVLAIAVPNAQAFTGAYWAYEDFTHQTLYTSGSVHYLLRSAGFDAVDFVDIKCTADSRSTVGSLLRRMAWFAYSGYYRAMCRLLASPTHAASPYIFSYEIKAIAKSAAGP